MWKVGIRNKKPSRHGQELARLQTRDARSKGMQDDSAKGGVCRGRARNGGGKPPHGARRHRGCWSEER